MVFYRNMSQCLENLLEMSVFVLDFSKFPIGFLAITSVLLMISIQISYQLKLKCISFATANSIYRFIGL